VRNRLTVDWIEAGVLSPPTESVISAARQVPLELSEKTTQAISQIDRNFLTMSQHPL
jgi:hypothetical protein